MCIHVIVSFSFIIIQVTETEECGGYVCEFLSLPDENVQTRCGICLLIIRKPYEVTCCGKLFCESCIIREMREKRGCPNCKKEDYGASLSKSNERYLNQQKVCCAHCADGCMWKGELGKHDKHLNQTTDLEQKIDGCFYARLNCRFGCGTTLPRFKILYHEMYECTKQVKDLNPREELFLRKIHELFQELIQRDTREKSASSTAMQPSEGATAVVSVQHQIEVQHTSSNPAVVPVEYTIDSFTDRMNYGRDYVSEPFYTHPKGYKMCVWVHPKGYGTAENTHVSVFICFVKGEYDDKLKWPFRGTITVQLLNQANDRDHREHIITYDKSNSYYGRKVVTEEKSKGFGVFEAMSHETLKDTKYCQYVKDDCLKIRICKVLMPPKKRMFSL
jgi:TNF receptor-associated factor 4